MKGAAGELEHSAPARTCARARTHVRNHTHTHTHVHTRTQHTCKNKVTIIIRKHCRDWSSSRRTAAHWSWKAGGPEGS